MKLYIFIFIVFIFIGCDTPGVLRIENDSGGNALYITHQLTENGAIEKVELEIADDDKKEFIFGFGQHWSDNRINEYLSLIDKVEIFTTNDTIVLSDKKELYNYFRNRRKGLFKQIIKIKIE